jgi:hypothetical protein
MSKMEVWASEYSGNPDRHDLLGNQLQHLIKSFQETRDA